MFTFQSLLQLAEALENKNTTEQNTFFLIAKAVEYKKQNLLFDYLLSFYPPFQKLRQRLANYESQIRNLTIETAAYETLELDVHKANKIHSHARDTAKNFLRDHYHQADSTEILKIAHVLEKKEIQNM